MIEFVLGGVALLEGRNAFMTDGFATPKFHQGTVGVELLNHSRSIRKQPRRINHPPEVNEVFAMLAEQDVALKIIEPYSPEKHEFLCFVSNTGLSHRTGKELGRYYNVYVGPNEIAVPIYCFSIIPAQITGYLRIPGIRGYCENDIKRAFAGITPTKDLARWLALHIGSEVYLPTAGTLGFCSYPGVFGQLTNLFNQLRSPPKACAEFKAEILCAIEELPPEVRSIFPNGLLNLFNDLEAKLDSENKQYQYKPFALD